MDFKEQYKHPKWQKRRLDYMDMQMKMSHSDVPCCDWCTDTETQLQLHHIRYKKNRKIWEYDDDELLLLCENCHRDIHEITANINQFIDNASRSNEFFWLLYMIMWIVNTFKFPDIYNLAIICKQTAMLFWKNNTIKKYKSIFEDNTQNNG